MNKILVFKSVSMQSLKVMIDMAGLQTMEMNYFKFLDSMLSSTFGSIYPLLFYYFTK